MVSITLVYQPMNFLKNILNKKEEPIQSYQDFWNWFLKNERDLYKVMKEIQEQQQRNQSQSTNHNDSHREDKNKEVVNADFKVLD